MIIGKKFRSVIAFLLVLCLLLCALLSCRASNLELPLELLNEDELEETTSPDPLTLYRIVIPSSCTATLFSAANDLAKKLTEQTGIASEVLYDTEAALPSERAVEILLGRCERTEAKRALSPLRRDDYLCQVIGNTTVLGGNSEAATLAALDRFYEEFFAYATAYTFLPASASFLHRAEYSISSVTVNGFELCEYTILYDNTATSKEYALAKYLQERIRNEGGYVLDLISADEFQGACKQIHLTIDPEEVQESYQISANERGITLSSHDLFGLSLAVMEWSERLLSSSENGSVSLSVAQESVSYSHIAPTIASLWLPSETQGVDDLQTIESTIKKQHPDLIFTDQLSEMQKSSLSNWLSHDYSTKEAPDLLQAQSVGRLLSDVSQLLACSAKLYQIGEDTDAFLLLTLNCFPTKQLSEVIKDRSLPLVVIVHTDASSVSDAKAAVSEDGLTLEHFENYQYDGIYRSFAIYTEASCFEEIQAWGNGGYRSFTICRSSAFYPHPS